MIEELEQLNSELEKRNKEIYEGFMATTEELCEATKEIERLNNIIKEVREYIKTKMEIRKNCENIFSYDIRNDGYIKQVDELLEILDKVGSEKE